MRLLILSDIHANDAALEAVLEHAKGTYDKVIFLGDLLGYGPDAVAVAQKAEAFDEIVLGNHDVFYLELRSILDELRERRIVTEDQKETTISEIIWSVLVNLRKSDRYSVFQAMNDVDLIAKILQDNQNSSVNNGHGFEAMLRNIFQIQAQNYELDWFFKDVQLKEIPKPISITFDGYHLKLVHGSLADSIGGSGYIYPGDNSLMRDLQVKRINKRDEESPIIICSGHSHIPIFVAVDDINDDFNEKDTYEINYEKPLKLGKWLTLINPGSVGFPRDRDPRAAYALLDTDNEEATFFRVNYDQRSITSKMRSLQYPKEIQERLASAEFPRRLSDTCRKQLARRIKDEN